MRQIVDDPAGDHDWGLDVEVDLDASDDDGAPVMQVNYEFHERLTPETAERVVEDYKSGRLTPRGPSGASRS